MTSPNFILIGRSGSGKGTQAELLVKFFANRGQNLFYISSGQLFRRLAEKDTDLGQRIKKIISEGGLPPEEIAMALWASEIAFNLKSDQGLIFDGAPRKLWEAEHLDRFLKYINRYDNLKVLLIDISEAEAFKRLRLRARSDDTDDAIKNRLDFYSEHVSPVVEHYTATGKLIKVNGEQSIEKIHEDILGLLELK